MRIILHMTSLVKVIRDFGDVEGNIDYLYMIYGTLSR